MTGPTDFGEMRKLLTQELPIPLEKTLRQAPKSRVWTEEYIT